MLYRKLLFQISILFLSISSSQAGCLEEIRTMYARAIDMGNWPAHRSVETVYSKDGQALRAFETVFEKENRQITWQQGEQQYELRIGENIWVSRSFDGPWKKIDDNIPTERNQFELAQIKQMLANMHAIKCFGMVQLGTKHLLHYRFSSKTDPDDKGNFNGATEDVYIDPKNNRVARWEMSKFVNKVMRGEGTKVFVELFEYDKTIKIQRPK